MPDLFFADLVRETSTASGPGPLLLGGATPGHRSFADAVPAGVRFHYAIAGVAHEQQWEVGEGEHDGTRLTGRNVLASSADNALVDFLPGLKIVTLTVASSWFAQRQNVPAHNHSPGQIEGLQAALDGKQAAGSYAAAEHGHGALALDGGSAESPSLRFGGDEDSGFFQPGADTIAVSIGGQERARFTPSGAIGIGTTNPVSPLHVRWNGYDPYANRLGALTLQGAYGGGLVLQDGVGHIGLWATEGGDTLNISLGAAMHRLVLRVTSDQVRAGFDNVSALGDPAVRWSQLYAATGTINTSDEREKHWLGPPDATELAAGRAILNELGLFQWMQAREAKGPEQARRHFGLRAQRAFAILNDHGLDWRRYGWCCHDIWTDDDGVAHDRYGIRPDQLALFLIAVLAHAGGLYPVEEAGGVAG